MERHADSHVFSWDLARAYLRNSLILYYLAKYQAANLFRKNQPPEQSDFHDS